MTKVILSMIFLYTLVSCSEQDKNPIYYEGREFTYIVEIIKDDKIRKHTLKLKVTNALWSKIMTGGQTGIEYIYKDIIDSTTGKPLFETTGAIDKDNRVFIHPPRKAYMAFAEIPPMPNIYRNTEVGTTSESVLSVVKGHGILDGKKIKQVDTVVAKKDVKLLGKEYNDVWIIHGENTNYLDELGKYRAVYWFEQTNGFIRMKYTKPNSETVDLKLKEIKH